MPERRSTRGGTDGERLVKRGREKEQETGGEEEQETGGGPRRTADGITAGEAAQAALRALAELTGKQPEGVTAVEPTEDGWLVGIEVLEDQRVPSSADILAIYEAELDPDGSLMSYRRGRRYPRGRGDNGEGR